MRVFKVSNSAGQSVIVEATSAQAAVNHIASKHYKVEAVKASDILGLVKAGTTVETVPARMREANKPAVKEQVKAAA